MGETTESIRVDLRKPIEKVGCRVYLASAQSNLVNGVWTKVLLDTVSYDLGTNFAANKFTAPVAGLYVIWGHIDFENTIANKDYAGAIYINGSVVSHHHSHTGGATTDVDVTLYDEFYLDKADYVELYAQSNSGGDTVDIEEGSDHTHLGVRLVSKEGIKQ
jgi:hypothetical protein